MAKKNWIFWIAFKFWRSKKSFSIVNIISGISFWGITIGCAALIIILSAFNGLENVVSNMFSSFNSDLRIETTNSKYFNNSEIDTAKILKINGIDDFSFVVEDICMVRYADRQQVVFLKGVEPAKGFEKRLSPLMLDGFCDFGNDSVYNAVVGVALFYSLGINLNDFFTPLNFYAPKRNASASMDMTSAFNSDIALPVGMFSVQQEFDEKYIITHINLARTLFDSQNISNAMEISVDNDKNIDRVEAELQDMLGSNFNVKNKIEQEETLYKIMKGEKLVVFLILSLILLIISLTMISTLTLEIIGKRKDLSTIHALGANISQVRKIIIAHGFIISFVGMLLGFVISIAILLLHQRFGLVRLGGDANLIVDIYPVKIMAIDFLYVFLIVSIIAVIITQIPIRKINKDYFYFRD